MAEHAPDRVLSGIDIPKTIAGVLAAVSAAVVGSFLGVAGTLVGAALASIVGSVGTEIYQRWIHRGTKTIVSTFVTAPAAVGTPTVVAAEEETPSQPEPVEEGTPPRRNVRWGRLVLVAGALFVLAMGTLTAFELVTGKSAADAVGNQSSSGTTIGSVLTGNDKKSETPAPTTSSAPADAPADQKTNAPATTEPTPGATTDPAAPAGTTDPAAPPTDTTTGGATGGTSDNQDGVSEDQGTTDQSGTGGSDQGGTGGGQEPQG